MNTKKSKPWKAGQYVLYYSGLLCVIREVKAKSVKLEIVGSTEKKSHLVRWLSDDDFWTPFRYCKRISIVSAEKRGYTKKD